MSDTPMTLKWSTGGNGSFGLCPPPRPNSQIDSLPNGLYEVLMSKEDGIHLRCRPDGFQMPPKLYGIEEGFVKRVALTWAATSENMGVMLTGLRGTGKTVTAELIALALDQPIILISQDYPGIVDFIDAIPHPVTIFVDEFEKVFSGADEMGGGSYDRGGAKLLPIMDGAMNSKHKKAFVLTTNSLRVNENFLQRPGRIRYLREFGNLKRPIIETIVSDLVHDTELILPTINFIAHLEIVTMDIVTAICEEMNIHGGDPADLEAIFNVRRMKVVFDVKKVDKETADETTWRWDAEIQPEDLTPEHVGEWLLIDGTRYGKIQKVQGEFITFASDEEDEEKFITVRVIRRQKWNADSFGRDWKPDPDFKLKPHSPSAIKPPRRIGRADF